MKYKTGRIGPRLINLETIDFAVDTTGNWEGSFPLVGRGDHLVTIGHVNGDPEPVLVSRRSTNPIDTDHAAEIALSAFAERHRYETDDNGNIIRMSIPDVGTVPPCWVERVDIVTT